MTSRTLSHYQILEPLGSGGMGEVFKARDTRLNRLVAVKVLRPEHVSQDVRKQRFIQEAQAASALNHPNIVTIYDIDQEDGVDFLVMEYIAGRTLDARIPRQGMRLNEALRVAVQIAESLQRAQRMDSGERRKCREQRALVVPGWKPALFDDGPGWIHVHLGSKVRSIHQGAQRRSIRSVTCSRSWLQSCRHRPWRLRACPIA